MQQEYIASRRIHVDRDPTGQACEVLHFEHPFASTQQLPQLVASEYLRVFGDLYGIAAPNLTKITRPPEAMPDGAGVELRYLDEKRFFDMTTVAYQQTLLGLPVRGAGLAVHVQHNPSRVISSASTAHDDLEVEQPTDEELKAALDIDEKKLAAILGLDDHWNEKEKKKRRPKLLKRRLVIHRYEAGERLPHPEKEDHRGNGFHHAAPTLPVGEPGEGLEDGQHYVASELTFRLDTEPWGKLAWVVLLDVRSLAVLYLRAFVDNVDGLVFQDDPVTASGNPATAPSSTSAVLNPLRTTVTLQDLDPPSGGVQALRGANVELTDFEVPSVAPPTETTGTDFDYDARSDNFAAVNAYHHCNDFFRLVVDLGFPLASYFAGTTFPTPVDHRGRFGSTDGIEMNASCTGTGTGGILETDFELADLTDTSNPLGIAADRRVVFHELGGHGVLYDHVNSANFGFAHSAGDSFAAILEDPDSNAPDRGLTFPWLTTTRRHDRDVASGWAWGGIQDDSGYGSEQILSSTHFRIYRAIGGDSSNINTRRFAARFMAYLMLRAIGTLTPATNPSNASGLAAAEMTVDLLDWTSEGHSGGAYNKVIRWAFEQQGLYQASPPAGSVTTEGAPPPVDVYIDDGRQGEYTYLANHWSCQQVWNRLLADGGSGHQTPVVGVTNYAYVKVKNRGTTEAQNVVVKGFHCKPSAGLVWPNDWQAMATPQLSGSNVAPNDTAEITVGPFNWVPSQVGHECMLMIVSADGDPSNIDNFTAGDSIPEWRLVPHDNNIGQRNVAPIAGGGGGGGLLASFEGKSFWVANPLAHKAPMELEASLPEVLERRGWRLQFANAGGERFTLEPGREKEIRLVLVPGGEFTPADIEKLPEAQRRIDVWARADGILIGGMSYELDPSLQTAPTERPLDLPGGDVCIEAAGELLDKLDISSDRIADVRVCRITLEIDLHREHHHHPHHHPHHHHD